MTDSTSVLLLWCLLVAHIRPDMTELRTLHLPNSPLTPLSSLTITAWLNSSPQIPLSIQLFTPNDCLFRITPLNTNHFLTDFLQNHSIFPLFLTQQSTWTLITLEIDAKDEFISLKTCFGMSFLTCRQIFVQFIPIYAEKLEFLSSKNIFIQEIRGNSLENYENKEIFKDNVPENCLKKGKYEEIGRKFALISSKNTNFEDFIFDFPTKITQFSLTLWLELASNPSFSLFFPTETEDFTVTFAILPSQEYIFCINHKNCLRNRIFLASNLLFMSLSMGEKVQICVIQTETCEEIEWNSEISGEKVIFNGNGCENICFYDYFVSKTEVELTYSAENEPKNRLNRELQSSHMTKFAYTRFVTPGQTHTLSLYNNNQSTSYLDLIATFLSGTGTYNLSCYHPYPTCLILSISSVTTTTYNRIYASDAAAVGCGGLLGLITVEVVGVSGSFQVSVEGNVMCADSGSACFCGAGRYPNPSISSCTTCPVGAYECANYQTLGCIPFTVSSPFPLNTLNCATCAPNLGLNTVTGLCVTCDSSCLSCSLPNDASKCSACFPNAVLAGAAPNSCQCAPGFFAYPNIAQCGSCDSSCAQCTGVNPGQCTGCWSGASLVGGVSPGTCQCVSGTGALPNSCLCDFTCATCTAAGATNCLTCKSNAELQGASPSSCICSPGYFPFPNAASCLLCNNQCATCTGSLDTQCVSCRSGATLLGAAPNSCRCQTGFYPYPDPSLCLPCPSDCSTCTSSSKCASCFPGASLSLSFQCLCLPGYYPNPTSTTCSHCYSLCKTCSAASICDTCVSNTYLQGNLCVCNDGFYLSGESQTCIKCQTGCLICSISVCLQCESGLFIYGPYCVSDCPSGYSAIDSVSCQSVILIPPVPVLYPPKSTSLQIDFSKPMNCTISSTDISIDIKDPGQRAIAVTWSSPYFPTNQVLLTNITLDTTYITPGTTLYWVFLHPENVTDIYGVAINVVSLIGEIEPFGTNIYPNNHTNKLTATNTGRNTAIGSKSVLSLGIATSLLAGSPLGFMQMFNQLQLLTYISMSKIHLPEEFASTLAGLNAQEMVPSLFSLSNGIPTITPPDYIQEFGLETCVFLSNIVTMVLVVLGFVVFLGGIMVLFNAKNRKIVDFARRQMKKVKWSAVIEIWLTVYLDLGIFSLLQLKYLPESFSNVYLGISYVLALLFSILYAVTPIVIVVFTYWNINHFTSRTDSKFNTYWGVLYLSFRPSSRVVLYLWFPLFVVRRFVLGVTLVLAEEYPGFIVGFNTAVGGVVFMYVAIARPYQSKFAQVEAAVIEGWTFVGYLFACLFHYDVNPGDFESMAVWSIRIAVAVTATFSLLRTLVSLQVCMRWVHKRRSVASRYQIEATRTVNSGDQLQILDEFEGIINTKGPL